MTEPASDPTGGGRYIVVAGRSWRATDPSIPASLRQELVAELMSTRRAVKEAGADGDAMARARARVHDAKVALGERGRPWWDDPEPTAREQRIAATIRALTGRRGPDGSVRPSAVAKVVAAPDWRSTVDQSGPSADTWPPTAPSSSPSGVAL